MVRDMNAGAHSIMDKAVSSLNEKFDDGVVSWEKLEGER